MARMLDALVRAFAEPMTRRRNVLLPESDGILSFGGTDRIHILILEGSFCPVHAGHLQLVKVAKQHLERNEERRSCDGHQEEHGANGKFSVIAFLVASPDGSLKRKLRRNQQGCRNQMGSDVDESDDAFVSGHHRNAMLELAVKDTGESSWIFVARLFELAESSSSLERQPSWDDVPSLARRAVLEAVMVHRKPQQSTAPLSGLPIIHVHKVFGVDAAPRMLRVRRKRHQKQGEATTTDPKHDSVNNCDLLCIANREMDGSQECASVLNEVYKELRCDQIVILDWDEALNLSSTKIRKQLRAAPVSDRSLVDSRSLQASVLQYIHRHSLFDTLIVDDVENHSLPGENDGVQLTEEKSEHFGSKPSAHETEKVVSVSKLNVSEAPPAEDDVSRHLSSLSCLPVVTNVWWDVGENVDSGNRKPIGLGMSSSVFVYKGSFATPPSFVPTAGVCLKIFRNDKRWVLESFLAEITVFDSLWGSEGSPPHSSIVRCTGAGMTCGRGTHRHPFLMLERIPGGCVWSHLSPIPHPQIANVNWHRSGAGGAAAVANSPMTKTPIPRWTQFPPDGGWGRAVANLADAIAHIHHHGILHGDLTVANVLYDDSDAQHPRLVLSDFGCALETNHTIPSPPYKPIEVFQQQEETKSQKRMLKRQKKKALQNEATTTTSSRSRQPSAYDELSEVYCLVLLVVELARRVPLWPVGARVHKNPVNLQHIRQGHFPGPKCTEVEECNNDHEDNLRENGATKSWRWDANVRASPVVDISSTSLALWAQALWKAEWAQLLYPCAQVERESRMTAAQLATALSLLARR